MRRAQAILVVLTCSLAGGTGLPLAWAGDEAPPEEAKRPPLALAQPDLIEKADGTVLCFHRPNFVAPGELQRYLQDVAAIDDVACHELARMNVLVLHGSPEAVELALGAAACFDRPVPQVFLEAKIVRMTRTSAEGSVVQHDGHAVDLPPGSVETVEDEGRVETLGRPSVLLTQGVPAEVSHVETRPLLRLEAAADDGVRCKASVATTSVMLKVVATHVGDQAVTLDVEVVVQGLHETSVLTSPSREPATTEYRTRTTVTVRGGAQMVIGSLAEDRLSEQASRPEVVLDHPLLSQFFPHARRSTAKTEVVVTLTPYIVNTMEALGALPAGPQPEGAPGAGEQDR